MTCLLSTKTANRGREERKHNASITPASSNKYVQTCSDMQEWHISWQILYFNSSNSLIVLLGKPDHLGNWVQIIFFLASITYSMWVQRLKEETRWDTLAWLICDRALSGTLTKSGVWFPFICNLFLKVKLILLSQTKRRQQNGIAEVEETDVKGCPTCVGNGVV